MEEITMQDHNVITYTDYTAYKRELDSELQKSVESFVKIGYLLKVARDTGILTDSGYSNVNEFAKKEYGLEKTQVSRFIRINDRFSIDGYSMELKAEYKRFGYAKLAVMLTLPDSVNQLLTPKMSTTEIGAVKKEVEEERKISDIEVMIEQEPQITVQEESLTGKALLNILHDYPELYREIHKIIRDTGSSGEQEIKQLAELLAPAGNKVYITRVPGIGRIAAGVTGPEQDIKIIEIRTNETQKVSWDEIRAIFQRIMPEEQAEKSWSMVYGEPFPEEKNAAVAPVQPKKEAHVQIHKNVPPKKQAEKTEVENPANTGKHAASGENDQHNMAQNTPKTEPEEENAANTGKHAASGEISLHDIEPDIPETDPKEPSEEKEEENAANTGKYAASGEEQQIPGQDDIMNHPEYLPEELEKEENASDIGTTDNKNINRGYKSAVTNNLNTLQNLWNSGEPRRIEKMISILDDLHWRLRKIEELEAENEEK